MRLHYRLRVQARMMLDLARRRRLAAYVRSGTSPSSLDESARHLLRWTRAAFAAGDGGASAGYHIIRGWDAPYPEITGYFLPTLLRAARVYGDASLIGLAESAGAWLIDTRLSDGSICRKQWTPGSAVGSVFNTGQVLDGWCALYERSGESRWLEAAARAGEWIVERQEPDGRWLRGSFNDVPHTYYARVAWPLARLGMLSGDERFRIAAIRHFDWVLSRQEPSGWFADAGFDPREVPTTHTIAYVLEGLLEGGVQLGEERFVDAAEHGAMAMRDVYERLGRVPGRLGSRWEGTARWRCLTGDAQTGLVWARLAALRGRPTLRLAAERIAWDLVRTQRLKEDWTEVSGALQGSDPPWGDYDPYRYPSHAAKFMLDLLMELRS